MSGENIPLAVRWHVALVRRLRPELVREFGPQLVAALTDLHDDVRGRPIAMSRLWARELRSLFANVLRRGPGGRHPRRTPGGSSDRPRRRRSVAAIWQDLRYAVRGAFRSPAFTFITVASLSVGIGGATVVFSVVNAMLLRARPGVTDAGRLVTVYTSDFSGPRYGGSSLPDFFDFRSGAPAIEDAAVYDLALFNYRAEDGATVRVVGERVSGGYLGVLGARPVLGRGFVTDEAEVQNQGAVILGYGFWQRMFGGDPDVLGTTVRLGSEVYTVIGVAPAGLQAWGMPIQVDVLVPFDPRVWESRESRGLGIVARTVEGVSVETLQGQLDLIAGRLFAEYPDMWRDVRGERRSVTAVSEADSRVSPGDRGSVVMSASLLLSVMGLVLLVACSNVANLLLNRASSRRMEIAVRIALGSSRTRLVGLLLTEAGLMAGLAGLIGLGLAYGVASVISSGAIGLPIPGTLDIGIDLRVAAFALAVSVGTGLAFGLAPALRSSRVDISPALRGIADTTGNGRFSLRNGLVVAQIAGSTVLIVGSTIFFRSLGAAGDIDLGFEPAGVATVRVNLTDAGYGQDDGAAFWSEVLDHLSGTAGVEAVALASRLPLGPGQARRGVRPQGYVRGEGEDMEVHYNVVSSDYFDVVGMRLSRGRVFDATDRVGGRETIVVNQAFVDRFWPGDDPLGRTVLYSGQTTAEVVGVMSNAQYNDLTSTVPYFWIPAAQEQRGTMTVLLRGPDPGALFGAARREIATVDPDVPVVSPRLLADGVADATAAQRMASTVLGIAGVGALVLAMIGVYGVLAYAVSRRTREVGVRVALGARANEVMGMVVGQGLRLAALGIVLGVAATLPLGMLLQSMLHGVEPYDPVALGSGILALTLATGLASAIPARRAARVDPIEALRFE